MLGSLAAARQTLRAGTVAEATRFHDDKSNYTGMHRNRAGNVEGAAEAQPQPTNAPSTLQTQALLQRRASLRANIDKNKEV